MAVLLLLVAAAVALFVTCGLSGSRYEYLEKEVIDTEYGVDGLVKEKRERYAPIYARQLTIGIILCILAVLPVFVVSAVSNDLFVETAATCFMLAVIALAVFMIVHTCIIKGSMDVLLQEGDYSRKAKLESKRNSPIAIIYWSIALTIFLAYSFLSGDWGRSWIVWPIAGVLYGAVAGIMQILNERE